VVWTMLAPGSNANIELWFDGTGLVAYASFEPPLNVEFDIQPGLAIYDSVADEILKWAESRRHSLAQTGKQTIPKALAMLGYDLVCLATALDSDTPGISRSTPRYARAATDAAKHRLRSGTSWQRLFGKGLCEGAPARFSTQGIEHKSTADGQI
jgi:hypothetical protein